MCSSEDRLLSIEELCERWSVSERYLRDLRDKRVFPGIKLFGRKHVRYPLKDVLAVERGEWTLPDRPRPPSRPRRRPKAKVK